MNFAPFGRAVHERFVELSKGELFVVGDHNTADNLYAHYLASFPAGTNPVYIKNTEHDCSCCRNFIKNLGRVVAIGEDGQYQTVWQILGAEAVDDAYLAVALAMDSFVRSRAITGLFRTKERSYGAEITRQLDTMSGNPINWHHFHGKVANRHFSTTADTVKGEYAANVQVFRRGLEELQAEDLQTVLDLIDSKGLYRGEEFRPAVEAFMLAQKVYERMSGEAQTNFIWANATGPAARFRNTAIGTLLQDLAEGKDLEHAVKAFEAKVAPANYKRPSALITPRMVQDAMKTITELDLEDALKRRFARIDDISVNNVLWVDNSVRSAMKGGIADILMDAATPTGIAPRGEKVSDISIDDFMQNVLPAAKSMELFVKNAQQANFVSLTAPAAGHCNGLFKWDNSFAWSYDGNITDSIKEKVKRAGGNVTNAKLRISLAWFNPDDLDIHVFEPNGNRIYFGNKQGKLDVDMNAFGVHSATAPVENVSFISVMDGVYRVHVNQYQQRSTSNMGFELEVENNGQIQQFQHTKAAKGTMAVLEVHVKGGQVTKIVTGPDVVGGAASTKKWGIDTETFVKVDTVMYSPNYWDDNAIGNKHVFFMLAGCKNDLPTRGIYNEFLNSNLEKHRKVFEVLGDKTKCQPTDDQLSGVGFSSTRGDEVLVRVTGAKIRTTYNIKF